MAIEKFTAALKDQAYKFWLNNFKDNIITTSSSSLRRALQSDPNKNNFLITDDKIRDMVAYVTAVDTASVSSQTIAAAKARMIEAVGIVKNNGIKPTINRFYENQGRTEVIIENVNFQSIETILEAGFGQGKIDGWKRSVGSGYHRGHVLGIPTLLLDKAITDLSKEEELTESYSDQTRIGLENKNILVDVMKRYRNVLLKQDLDTSNMGQAASSYDVYAKYTKDPEKYLIEMQIGAENLKAGQEAGTQVGELRKVLLPSNSSVLKNITASLKSPSVILDYFKQEGSPPQITLMVNSAVQPLTDKKLDTKTYKSPKVKVADKKIKVLRSKEDRERTKKEIVKINKFIKELQNLDSRIKKLNINETNLARLQNIINAGLQEQIRKNMGTGDRRDVLNYRTGRFAGSARVERLSESRQGMITAFYTYMKNPYATFSRGGLQERPYTRDPKTLISKSIRELAGPLVSNRMRAVLV